VLVERLLRFALLGSSWVLYLLLALSVASFAAAFERLRFFRRHRDDLDALAHRLHVALFADDFDAADAALAASPAIEARVVRSALRWKGGGAGAVADVVESELGRERAALERGLTLLGTLGNNAPFVGLLGTVLGVIEAFHHLGGGQTKEAMGNVMAGIAEALVATGVGLFVALPAVVAYNLAQKRISDIEAGVASLSKLVTAALKSRERDGAATFAWALPDGVPAIVPSPRPSPAPASSPDGASAFAALGGEGA
jgi:biopolymer transport protein ExbB